MGEYGHNTAAAPQGWGPTGQDHSLPTLKMGSRMSWQKVRGSFFPSGLLADLLNLPLAGSKYLVESSHIAPAAGKHWARVAG